MLLLLLLYFYPRIKPDSLTLFVDEFVRLVVINEGIYSLSLQPPASENVNKLKVQCRDYIE